VTDNFSTLAADHLREYGLEVELTLGLISFLTSLLAGVFGFGGGMLLIAILPIYLTPAAVIPVHGITQLASNSSRMIFSWEHIHWNLLPKFLIGSLLGIFISLLFLSSINTAFIPVAIGIYILISIWSTTFSKMISRYENYYIIGFLQTGLGMFVGATGPLALSVLTRELKCKDAVVATSSVFMTISHLAKIPVFIAVGFSLTSMSLTIIFMVIGAIVGSFVGTRVRKKLTNKSLLWAIKGLLTVMAIRMIIVTFIS
jgi:uncharacterized membrane protein YfcA